MSRPPALLLWCTLFGVAFGYIEGSVVVYLRELLYPEGFRFPLTEIEPRLLGIEVVREAATLLLLWAVARLAATGGLRRLAVFAFCFGVWDLAYYLTLKVWLDWPATVLDWDVLFLIPVPWAAPVLAPVLVSAALVAAAAALLLRTTDVPIRPLDRIVEVTAGVLILSSFFTNVPALAAGEAPSDYPWLLFFTGWIGGGAWFFLRILPSSTSAGEAASGGPS